MSSLDSYQVSNLSKTSELLIKLGQIIQDHGGMVDDVFNLIRKERDASLISEIGIALTNTMFERVLPEPKEIKISTLTIGELLTNFKESEHEGLASISFSEQVINFFRSQTSVSSGKYEVFKTKVQTPFECIEKFAAARNMKLPTYREFLSFYSHPMRTFDYYVNSLACIPNGIEGSKWLPVLRMNFWECPIDGFVPHLSYSQHYGYLLPNQYFLLRLS